MKLIEIQTWDELEKKLNDLKGKNSLYIKIKCKDRRATIKVIDLKNFSGSIDISFENDCFYNLTVLTDNRKINAFFTNASKTVVVIDKRPFLKIDYKRQVAKPIVIHSEKEIRNDNLPMLLANNICLTRRMLTGLKEKQINGNNYVVYINKDNIYDTKYFYNCHFVIYDKIIFINEAKDFAQLKKIRQGNILVFVNQSISRFAMKSVDLISFSGNLYLLGNNHCLKNGTIFNSSKNAGLFGTINPSANIWIEDFGLDHLIFAGKIPLYFGAFVGNRETNKFYSNDGKVIFKNCYVKNCLLQESFIETGVLVGNPNIDYEFIDFFAYNNFCNKKAIYFNNYLSENKLTRKNKN